VAHLGEWNEEEMDWTLEPQITRTISTIVCRLRERRLYAEANEVAALLRPLSVALDQSA
jgi:hypothetical protein